MKNIHEKLKQFACFCYGKKGKQDLLEGLINEEGMMSFLKWVFLILCFSVFLISQVSEAQVNVETIIHGTNPVDETEKVSLIRLGSFKPEVLSVNLPLDFGDELSCNEDNIAVVLKWATEEEGGSEFTLSAPFRVVLVPTDSGNGCAVSLQGGTVDVLADGETEIHSGEITLGSEYTMYRLKVQARHPRREIEREAFVYEGKISVRRPGIDRLPLQAGKKVKLRKKPVFRAVNIQRVDINRTAKTYAKVDISRTNLTGNEKKSALSRFTKIYETVLSRPDQASPRVKLAVARMNVNIRVPSTITYLNQATAIAKADTKQESNITFVKGLVYYQLGNKEAARLEIGKARRVNPEITKDKIRQIYKINPAILRHVVLPRPEALNPPAGFRTIEDRKIHVVSHVAPKTASPGQTVVIEVAVTAGGKPLAGAVVTLGTGGGVFHGSATPTNITGHTNSNGIYKARWHCRPCARGYGIEIEVKKSGFTPASIHTEVDIH